MQYQVNDPRNQTYKTRLDIGFSEDYNTWQTEKAYFSEHTLVINGHPVMEDWEDSYMEKLATIAASKGGRVLEVGFGMGISARYIQQNSLEEHIVIEANQDVYAELVKFAKSAPILVTPMEGFWQTEVAKIADSSIDGILFDTYPLTEAEIHCNHFDFFNEAHRILKPGGVLTYYSDEVTDFSEAHLNKLHAAGFTNISKEICTLDTPPDCKYWNSKTMIAPIIIK